MATASGSLGQRMVMPTLAEARQHCRRIARRHHENFTVVSALLPRCLCQHFYNVYAWCRLADNLADEAGQADQRLAALDAWQEQFDLCEQGRSFNAAFIALQDTMQSFAIPRQPFEDLLAAFRQDQVKRRYETFDELLAYCRYSANPVGRIVLYLGRYCDAETERLSDSVCTGLQLANFCQDVSRDWDLGRIYLPQESCRRFGYSEADFAARRTNQAFRRLLEHETNRAETYLTAGRPLVELTPPELRVDVALFIEGGLAILDEIRKQDFDVWRRRPTVSKLRKLKLLARCWWRHRRGGERAASDA